MASMTKRGEGVTDQWWVDIRPYFDDRGQPGEADRAIIGVGPSAAGISIPVCSKCEPLSVFVLPNGSRISCESNSSALLAYGRASCTGWFVIRMGYISHLWSVVGVCVEGPAGEV